MPSLPSLLKRGYAITRQIAALETARDEINRQILDAATAPRPRKPSAPIAGKPISPGVRETVKLLKDAGCPMGRKEIAEKLGIAGSAAGFRLAEGIKLGFIVKVGRGLYEVSSTVPVL